MERYISKETESDLTKLGLYQIMGGAIGIIIILWGMYKVPILTVPIVLLYLFIIAFFVYSIFCGVLCLKIKNTALSHSLINQLIQIIGISMFGFAFNYIAGLYLNVELDLTESFKFGLGAGISTFNFKINSESNNLAISFNVIAIIIVIWIDKLMKRVKTEMEIRKASSIGEN